MWSAGLSHDDCRRLTKRNKSQVIERRTKGVQDVFKELIEQ